MRIVKTIVVLILIGAVGLAVWLAIAPPDLVRVGANYSAKIVCSNVFIASRDPQQVLKVDVQAPGHPLLRLMRVSVDRDSGEVHAGLFGIFGGGAALYREGIGCATVADGDFDAARLDFVADDIREPQPGEWPDGDQIETPDNMDVDAVLNDPALTGPGMRAVIVVKDGRIVAERYGDGFDAETPLLGWSMTKTVTAVLIGRLVREGRLDIAGAGLFDGWTGSPRADITAADLLGMASDLVWNEGYGNVSDVTRMLYLEPDMAAFAAAHPLDEQTLGGIGAEFLYSSGTTVLLSRVWQDTFEDPAEALAWPREALFDPLGMRSAILETDARGTFAGSSYMYATARDWARFGQFLAQRGVWGGRSLLPVGFVDWMTEPHPASNGEYGRGHVWLRPPNGGSGGDDAELPPDAFFMSGHDGQSVTVVPSENLVVVRMGLTPSKLGYKVSYLVDALIGALAE
ncbi:serine hydrolase domain-containing protein [Oricola cellulosilytica]|uniref:Class C beta-lactamase-related serine hydrolase n=1 Tax=Oricola cellulosilytica TaxID=1429082 RepID=A0A4R0PAT7_9HYPH|nr:serine hydrolase [Oricola cellulosilytica]TCD14350.1 class C beta-lactamase-related serine hydrolase [Oricola cellulosilytica]